MSWAMYFIFFITLILSFDSSASQYTVYPLANETGIHLSVPYSLGIEKGRVKKVLKEDTKVLFYKNFIKLEKMHLEVSASDLVFLDHHYGDDFQNAINKKNIIFEIKDENINLVELKDDKSVFSGLVKSLWIINGEKRVIDVQITISKFKDNYFHLKLGVKHYLKDFEIAMGSKFLSKPSGELNVVMQTYFVSKQDNSIKLAISEL